MANSGQESLHSINPAGYPLPPVLSEYEKKQNKEWVAQKRAENAAKEAEKAKTATPTPTPTPTATGPSRPSFSPAGPPKATRVGAVEASRRQGGPIIGDPFTRAGMEKIRSGEHVDPRTQEGMRLARAQQEEALAEGPDVPITDPVRFDAHLVRIDPAKKAAIADYVNQQQAGLITSGLEAARENRALQGRGIRMINQYIQDIQRDYAGRRLPPAVQEAVAFDTYIKGSPRQLPKAIEVASQNWKKEIEHGSPEEFAHDMRRDSLASISGYRFLGHYPGDEYIRRVGRPKAIAKRGPVGGVSGRTFGADVAGRGGIKPRLAPDTETVTTFTEADPTPGKPRDVLAEAGEGPSTGTGQGPAKPPVLDLRGSGARAGSDRDTGSNRNKSVTPEFQADLDRAADFIKEHVEAHGKAPSIGVIANALDINKSRAQRLWEHSQIASTEAVSTRRAEIQQRRSATQEIMELPPGDEAIETESLYGRVGAYSPEYSGGYRDPDLDPESELDKQVTRPSATSDIPATPATRNPRSAKRRAQRVSDAEKLERQRSAKKAKEDKNK